MTSRINYYYERRRRSNLKSEIIKWSERGMIAVGLAMFWFLVISFVRLYLRFHG